MSFYSQSELRELGIGYLGEDVKISRKASLYNAPLISIGDRARIDDFCILSAGIGGIYIGNHVHLGAMASLIGRGRIKIDDFSTLSG